MKYSSKRFNKSKKLKKSKRRQFSNKKRLNRKIAKKKFDYIVMTQLTSPLRKSKDVEKAIKKTISQKFDALWTISKINLKYHPNKQLTLKQNRLKICVSPFHRFCLRRPTFH